MGRIMTGRNTYLLGCPKKPQPVFRNRLQKSQTLAGRHLSVLTISILLLALLVLPGIAYADDYVGGIPLTTVQSGTVTGGLWFDATPAPNWGSKDVTKTFTLPENAPGNITWARLYISAYAGHMQDDKAFTITNKFDGNGDGTYEQTWPETGHAAFHYLVPQDDGISGNDNSAFSGHGTSEPYKMINDHENRVTSDYLMWYDVTSLISSRTVNVNVNTVGSYDGRIKVITLVVAYNNASSATETTYWVNQGHDVCSYYTEDNYGTVAIGTTSFATTGLSGLTSATLTADYMASNNGYYAFPTSDNDFDASGGSTAVTGEFSNVALDRVPDTQGAYSGLDSWDVKSSLTGSNPTTFAYARYFPGTGTSGFYKIPLAILVVTSPRPAVTPVAAFTANATSGTAPLTVAFTDASTNTPTSWAWTFGDGSTGTAQNPVHTYTSAGTYTVVLTAANFAGSNTATETGYLSVSSPAVAPVANFTANTTSGTAPLTVAFTDASTNAPTSWSWNFGDGSTSTAQSPVHTYTAAGSYTVNLTATNSAGSDSKTRSAYVTVTSAATFNLTFTGANGAATVNPYPAYVFAWEPNTVQVKTIKNIGSGTATNIGVALYASDVSSTVPVNTTTIASLAAGSTASTLSIIDPTIRTTQGGTVTYTAVIDPDNLIAETNETDNTRTSLAKTVLYNGYKGKGIYWAGGTNGGNITTKHTFDLNGNAVYYTQPNTAYKGVGWSTRTETWTAANLPIPGNATIEKVYLYLSYNWDQTSGGYPDLVTTFNGNSLTPGTPYRDWSNFGAYADYEYGLYPAIDVTSMFVANSDNTLITAPGNSGADNLVALYPSTLVVVYSDPAETRKQIFINEECDELAVSPGSYGTTVDEATAYAEFSGMTIDTAAVANATLASFAGSAGPGEGNLLFNGQTVATNAWQGDSSTASAQSFDVKGDLSSTGNVAGIQGTTSGGMDALQQILVVEYTATRPTAGFTATPTSGAAPLNVTFTDKSENTPTSWLWDFGDNSTSTAQNPVHTYAAAGNYTVVLTTTNSGGSDTVTKTDYITVTTAVIALPDQTSAPTDPDHDGLYEDLNGNGRIDYGDLQLYFTDMTWLGANEPLAFFDYNGNGRIDYGDIQTLFVELGGS